MPFEDGKPDLAIPSGGHFEDELPSSLWRRLVADPAISLIGKGSIGVPEVAVGLADIVTGGYAGKAAEAVGFRPKEAKAYLDTLLSPEQQEANRYVEEAEGFFPTIGRALEKPSTIAHSVLESLPSVGAGGVIARGAMAAAPKLAPLVAGAMGEGMVSAGSSAEQIRQATPTGTLSLPQTALAAGSGAVTGGVGVAGGKLMHRLGITDIDTLIAAGKLPEGAKKNIALRIAGGAFVEGPLEELPQSAQEQIAQNLALGKPTMEGVPEAGAMGMLAGSVMGGGVAALPTKASTKEILDRNPDPRKSAEELLQKAAEDVIRGTDTLGATAPPLSEQIIDKQPETPNDQPQLNPVPSEQATPETTAEAQTEKIIPELGTIAPKTVAGDPVESKTDEQLQALAAAPETPANTRHAAVAALQSRNPEERPAPPEVESPILETPKGAEFSDRGVAPTQGGGLPEPTAQPAPQGPIGPSIDTALRRNDDAEVNRLLQTLGDPNNRGPYTASDAGNLAGMMEGDATLGDRLIRGEPVWEWVQRVQNASNLAPTATPPAPAASKTTKRIVEIDAELAKLQVQYEKKSTGGSRAGMVPPAIKVSALKSITQKMDRLDAERAALATPAAQPSPSVPKPQPEAAPPVEPVKAPTEPGKTTAPDHIAGKVIERFQGEYSKGMRDTVAKQHQKRLSSVKSQLAWTVEKSTIPEFPDRFDVVGRKPVESSPTAQPATPVQPAGEKATVVAEKASTGKESLPVAPEAVVKESWQYTRREFDAKGLGAVSEETLTRAQELNRKVDAAAKAMLDASGYWKHNKKGDLATRRSTIGALMEFEPHSVETALKSPKVARSLKDAYRTAKAEKDALSQSADIEASHETAVRNALAAGKPVPASVLADYPDLKQPELAKEAAKETGKQAEAGKVERERLDRQDVTADRLSEINIAYGEDASAMRKAKPADKMSATEKAVLARFADETPLEFVSKPLLYSKELKYLTRNERAALFKLLKRGDMRVERNPSNGHDILVKAIAPKVQSPAALPQEQPAAPEPTPPAPETRVFYDDAVKAYTATAFDERFGNMHGTGATEELATADLNKRLDAAYRYGTWRSVEHPTQPAPETPAEPNPVAQAVTALQGAVENLAKAVNPEAAAKPSESSATPAPESAAKRSETTTPPVLSEKEGSIPDTNTEDSGAELTYNRRNRIRAGIKWEDIADKNETLRVSETTKQNVYPKPDYDALIADDVQPIIAHIVKQVYDSIAAKPQTASAPTDENLKTYIESVNRTMAGALAWAKDKQAIARWAESQARVAGAMLGKPTAIIDLANQSKTLLDTAYPDGWKEHRDEIRIIGGNRVLRALQPGTDDARRAIKAVEAGWPTPQKAWEKSFIIEAKTVRNDDVPESERTGEPQERFFVMQKPSKWRMAKGQQEGGYASREAAIEAAVALSKRDGKIQVSDKGISVEAAERVGEAWRMEGEDVSSDKLRDTFGFKGVNFGTWMKGDSNQAERQLHLNHAYDSFMDLADLLGVPHKTMSLNGMLGVAIGAQGSGGAHAAHFVPGVNEINLTRTSGAGSLAHEFGHAVDHYFATQANLAKSVEPFLTEHMGTVDAEGYTKRAGKKEKAFGEGLRPEIAAVFKFIVTAMNTKQETAAQLQARVFEAQEKTKKRINNWLAAIKSDFLANKVDEQKFDALAERIHVLDLGDGHVVAGSANLSLVVDELRSLYKEKTGRAYSLDQIKGLQANVDHAAYLKSDKAAERNHAPQQVSTDYATNAAQLDAGKGGKKYWSTNLEKFARAFDAFVSDALAEKAAKNTYLSHAGRTGETIPTGDERMAINKAFQALVDTIETRDTDKGTALFERGESVAPGITEPTLRAEIAKAFGPRAEKMVGDILIPLKTQADIASVSELSDVVPLIRDGDRISGFYHPKTTKTYLVLENIPSDGVRGTILHEIGVHLGLEGMLGKDGYAAVVRRMEVMRKAGNKAVIEAHNTAINSFAVDGSLVGGRSGQRIYRYAYPQRDVLSAKSAINKLLDESKVVLGSSIRWNVRPSSLEQGNHGGWAAANNLSDLIVANPAIAERLSSVGVEAQRMVLSLMRTAINDAQVFKSVIEFIPVDMMDMLRAGEFPPKMNFHNVAMLVDLPVVDKNKMVSAATDAAGRIAERIMIATRARAESAALGASELTRTPLETNAASSADTSGQSAAPVRFKMPQLISENDIKSEELAYLVTNRPELPFIRRLIAEIKAFLFRKFGILGDWLTPDDIATLAKASVLHASEGVRGGEAQFVRGQDPAFQRTNEQEGAGYAISQVMRSLKVTGLLSSFKSPASFGIFRNINTQYHKAATLAKQGKPQFKAVFDKLQDYLNDISALAVTAEQKAPAWFRELTSLRPDAFNLRALRAHFKGVAKKPDIQAVMPWLNHGTLYGGGNPLEGRLWTKEELTSGYTIDTNKEGVQLRRKLDLKPLTEWQAELYFQAQAALAQALEDGAKAVIYRHVKRHGISFDKMESLDRVVMIVKEQLETRKEEYAIQLEQADDALTQAQERVAKAEERYNANRRLFDAREELAVAQKELEKAQTRRNHVQADLDTVTALIGTKENPGTIDQLHEHAQGLIDHGYMPLKRFGPKFVKAVNPDGRVMFRAHFDGIPLVPMSATVEMNRVADELKSLHPDWTITTGVKTERSWTMYNGLSLDALENFLDFLDPETRAGLERDKAMQTFLTEAVNNRSILKELIHRKGTPGFSQDGARILASFITSHARNASAMYHVGEAKGLVESIPEEQGDIADEASDMVNYVTDPGEEAAKLRGFLFFHFLGGSIAAGIINLSQTPMMTVPRLSQDASLADVLKAVTAAAKLAVLDPQTVAGEQGKALQKAEREGLTAPQQIYHLAATASNNPFSSNRHFRTLMTIWGGLFSTTEVFNRRVAFLAAYNLAKKNGKDDTQAYEYAKEIVDDTQLIYNKGNRPNWGRGAIGSTVLTFRTFTIGYLELLSRMPRKQQLMMLGMLLLMAGAEGLPGEDDMEDIVDTLGQWLGFSTNTGKWLGKTVRDNLGEEWERPILKGLGGMLAIDLHSRLGFGNLVPATAFFKPSEINKGRDVAEAVGPVGGVFKSMMDSLELLARGKWDKAAIHSAPKAARDLYNGIHMMATGESEDIKGRRALTDVTLGEGVGKAIGFNPQRASIEGEAKREEMIDKNLRTVRMDDIASDWSDAILRNDPEKRQKAIERFRAWNRDNPSLRISNEQMMRSVKGRIKSARLSSKERFLKSLPKSMRREAQESF